MCSPPSSPLIDQHSPFSYNLQDAKLQCDIHIDKVGVAYKIFKKNIMFHGTSSTSAQDIMQHGFQIRRKRDGATSILKNQYGIDDPSAQKHHYLMGLQSATRYAKMYDKPAVIAVIRPPFIHLSKDPEGHSDDEYMTEQDIPKEFILPSGNTKPSRYQLENACRAFDLSLNHTELDSLAEKIHKRITRKIEKNAAELLTRSTDFKTAEKQRNQTTLELLSKAGVNLSDLKEGETFSLTFN